MSNTEGGGPSGPSVQSGGKGTTQAESRGQGPRSRADRLDCSPRRWSPMEAFSSPYSWLPVGLDSRSRHHRLHYRHRFGRRAGDEVGVTEATTALRQSAQRSARVLSNLPLFTLIGSTLGSPCLRRVHSDRRSLTGGIGDVELVALAFATVANAFVVAGNALARPWPRGTACRAYRSCPWLYGCLSRSFGSRWPYGRARRAVIRGGGGGVGDLAHCGLD